MKEPGKITPDLVKAHGLTEEEYEKIKDTLGREPNFTELGIFSVMWSEHCSYKSSKPLLRLFPTSGKNILIKAGEENAGVVDIGDGLCVVMKMESHNHPSAVEPFQGASTGVGGILRDIFTMGARPIALLDSLRFGPLDNGRNRYLLSSVVGGIAAYGNCMGIPTVGGEVCFDETYEGNPLVNVMCVGVARRNSLVRARATGARNPVFYVGADTGRDGLGGASFASRELTEELDKDRPAVQIGDPFKEKLLLEACLELLNTGAVVGMQDMGAAGLTCSTSETASRGHSGMRVDLSLVPRREEGMIPYEVMLSESQERMLVIVTRGKEREARRVFDKWDLHAVPIGEVTGDEYLTVLDDAGGVAQVPARFLTEGAPVYTREERKPEYLRKIKDVSISTIPEPQDYDGVLKVLVASPSICSKRWVYEQYDHMVRTDTVLRPGADAALIRIKGTQKAIALSCDGNGRYCFLDPYEGGKIAVAEAARNVVCVGAEPIAITNCLNFGNPTKPHVFWQFRRCVEGMADACRILNTPVTGGNVSFYNENPKGAIDPTPVVGMLGLVEKMSFPCTPWFKREGDLIVLLGECREEIGGSEYLQLIHGLKMGPIPRVDLEKEKAVQNTCLELIRARLVSSSHDCSEGGLAVALAECCMSDSGMGSGAVVELEASPEILKIRMDALLFGETQSRILVSCRPRNLPRIERLARQNKVACWRLGVVRGNRLTVRRIKRRVLDVSLEELEENWGKGLSGGDD